MKITRKQFLVLTGGCLAALSGKKVLAVFEDGGQGLTPSVPETASRQRWGMVIDMRKCRKAEGCTQCTEVCDAAHNIPTFTDHAHEVKWIWKENFGDVFPVYETEYVRDDLKNQPLPVLCNHCASPPCVRVCPTGATWKREQDGIVMMDWHRCIGCRYCMAACPYGSRSFNWVDPRTHLTQVNPDFPTRTKGVVEKCTFCPERLAKGQLPACVEACPEKALVFGDLNDPHSEVRQLLGSTFSLQRKPELGTGPNVYYIV